MPPVAEAILKEARTLATACNRLRFSEKVWAVYNTFDYAYPGYEAYVRKYAGSTKKTLFLGMNPGPWGMAQTGVPFGEISAVLDWMCLRADIGKPPREHPKRPVEGLQCGRSEVSGRRLWGLFSKIFGSPEAFFRGAFILNYCPLAFLLESGANLTPDKLSAAEKRPLEAACDAHLRAVIDIFQPEMAVGVGGFATQCLQRLGIPGLKTGTLLHPSPASPVANREWPERPKAQLAELGLLP
ncbi:MAG: uracil-DNA glycosylase family protein [Opitutales bacterium]|jgi:single-strand selective monofunctional uracil DNA glycosylase